ncbi:hypothetical protein K2Q02_03035 [Patescibacteria group bacterium]|nr:hypothetical protein [Patescibacteria group bacterium]
MFNASAQERMTFKLEMSKASRMHNQIQLNATVGEQAIYSSQDNIAIEGKAVDGAIHTGLIVTVLPESVNQDGVVITKVSYTIQDKQGLRKNSHVVNIKHGETVPLFASAPNGESISLTLTK